MSNGDKPPNQPPAVLNAVFVFDDHGNVKPFSSTFIPCKKASPEVVAKEVQDAVQSVAVIYET